MKETPKFSLNDLFVDDLKKIKEEKRVKAAQRKAERLARGPRDPPSHFVVVTRSGRRLHMWEYGQSEQWKWPWTKDENDMWEHIDINDDFLPGETAEFGFAWVINPLPQEVEGKWKKKEVL